MERWYNNLDPTIKPYPFTFKEEMIFFCGFLKHGKKWSTIRNYLTGRPSNTLKNHWKCKMSKKIDYLNKKFPKFAQEVIKKKIPLQENVFELV